MQPILSRRAFVGASSLLGLTPLAGSLAGPAATHPSSGSADVWEHFPRQPLALVSAVVGAAHRDLAAVQELVRARPALAKATWDHGFGDWESALGAASHTGQREIALFLIENGARPDIFTFAMLGNLPAVKAMIEGSPGIQRLPGPHGIPLLSHAQAGGDAAADVAAYLESLGDAGRKQPAALEPSVLAACTGTYRITLDDGPTFEIQEFRGGLAFQRGGASRRGLLHVEGRAFAPVGAEHVRLTFEVEDGGDPMAARATAVTIRDGDPELRATRIV